MNRFTLSIFMVCQLMFCSNVLAQFSSGSTGAQGVFPPAAILSLPGPLGSMSINLATGVVSAYNANGGTLAGTAPLPGGATSGDAFPTGELNFITFNVPAVTLTFVPNSANTPVIIKTTGDAMILGAINIKGGSGTPAGAALPVVGKGSVGGADGGTAGNAGAGQISATSGGAGLGISGGKGGVVGCSNSGFYTKGGTYPTTNTLILPFVGGAGGGGGSGSSGAGATGGGGGGAILIASSTKIVVSGTIDATGGTGGARIDSNGTCTGGGGGSGGAIRLAANRIEIQGGTLLAAGGNSEVALGGAGIIRLEAYDYLNQGAAISPIPLTGGPVLIQQLTLPRLRISSIGGVSVPETPSDIHGIVDVSIPSGTNPMTIVVTGSNIPDGVGLTVVLKVSGSENPISMGATMHPVSNVMTATVSMSLPTGVSYIQAYTGQFSLNAELQRQLPLFQGEKILNASVEFDGQSEHVYFYTASGLKVRAETLLQR